MQTFRTRLFVVGLALTAGLATTCFSLQPSSAQEKVATRYVPPRPPSVAGVSLSLEDELGRPLRTFAHEGQVFVLGEFGERYSIRIHNPHPIRVEAVVTVDGRDVVSGRPGDFVRSRGYVLTPGGSVLIEGFRTSLSEVAGFRFTDPESSYSARMGTPQNVGVIGVALFPERRVRPPVPLATSPKRKESAPAEPGASESKAPRGASPAPAPARRAQNLGTAFGEGRVSEVREVPFERDSPRRPARVIVLRYDDAEGLRARGIDVFGELRPRPPVEPDPFPNSRFAPPPPPR